MLGFRKENFLYISIPKNGSTTFSNLLLHNGWESIELLDAELDWPVLTIWGHLTDPLVRHTKGLVEYLRRNLPDDEIPRYLSDDFLAKMLVTGMHDYHSMSVQMLLGSHINLPIHWIPLDLEINGKTGNDFTNDFFIKHGINLRVDDLDIKFSAKNKVMIVMQFRETIEKLKLKFNEDYQRSVKLFFDFDINLYNQICTDFKRKYTT
jgi:hypothetical protein